MIYFIGILVCELFAFSPINFPLKNGKHPLTGAYGAAFISFGHNKKIL